MALGGAASALALAPIHPPSPALLRYLRDDMRRGVGADAAAVDPAMRHATIKVAALPPTRRHGRLLVVYREDPCGRGSCGSLELYEPRQGTFRRVYDTQPVELPVVLLPGAHHGYPDLGVNRVVHDPAPRSARAVLAYDGSARAQVPVPQPGRPRGRVLIGRGNRGFTELTW